MNLFSKELTTCLPMETNVTRPQNKNVLESLDYLCDSHPNPWLSVDMTREEKEQARFKQIKQQAQVVEDLSDWNECLGLLAETVFGLENICDDISQFLEDDFENIRDACSMKTIFEEFFLDDEVPLLGDHLYVLRAGYTHHGIYVGEGQVVHYLSSQVQKDSLETFADGATLRIKPTDESPLLYDSTDVVKRAYRRLGENCYNVIFNNCEQFCRWCRCANT